MNVGDRITISGKRGSVEACVLDIRAVDDMPEIAPFDLRQVREIIAEMDVHRCAVIGYEMADNGRQVSVMFCALEDSRGQWWDLQGQHLTIQPQQTQSSLFDRVRGDTAYPD